MKRLLVNVFIILTILVGSLGTSIQEGAAFVNLSTTGSQNVGGGSGATPSLAQVTAIGAITASSLTLYGDVSIGGTLTATGTIINTGSASTTKIEVGNGTAGVPSITFSADPGKDTGLFSAGSNSVDVAIGGTNFFTINGNGIIPRNSILPINSGVNNGGLANPFGVSYQIVSSSTNLIVDGSVTTTATIWYAPNLASLGTTGKIVCQDGSSKNLTVQSGSCIVSSARFKGHIQSLNKKDLMDRARKLRAVIFNYKKGLGSLGTSSDEGFIAEEVALIDPYLVVYEEALNGDENKVQKNVWLIRDGKIFIPKTVDYSRISVILSGAIQDLDERVTALEERLYQ